MKAVLVFVLFGAQVLGISGYGSAKEGRCPRPKQNALCHLMGSPNTPCFMDIECPGTQKCCDDGCGENTCKQAILPPRAIQGQCAIDPARNRSIQQNPNCQKYKNKFCYKDNCKRCCTTTTNCNPNPNVYATVDFCTKVLCAKKTCFTQGEICIMDKLYNTPKCVCRPGRCPDGGDQPVCGTDSITYPSRCEMNKTACVLGDVIDVAYEGKCRRGGRNKIKISPSHVRKQSLEAGKRGKITCQFTGSPLQIIWDKLKLDRLPSNRMLPQDNVLEIKHVVKSDAGTYLCSAFDGVRSVAASVEVSVQEPKIITSKAIKPRGVCLQDKLIGTGEKYVIRFFFNSATRLCEAFPYGGSGGNENNFVDKRSCMRACSHSATDICHLPKRPGPCFSRFQKWFYDTRRAKCKMFVFGGCLGNANNFDNKNSCLQACSVKHVCSLPKAVGTCHGHTARYYFDAASKSCKKFIYSGCEGNANRFHSLKRCERKCIKTVRFGKLKVKPGICRAPIFEVRSCLDHSRDSCMSDRDCLGKDKCCFDGCHRTCSKPLLRAQAASVPKLGRCPAPKFSGKVCKNRYERDICQADHECPGIRKCCNNGCFNDCSMPNKIVNGRPKPGTCPLVTDPSDPELCNKTRHECSRDNDCFGRQKCCDNSCHRECMNVVILNPKPGQCPIQDAIEAEDCSDTVDMCSFDQHCTGISKCCFTGCKMECISPPGIKPGVCPRLWKGLNGICDRKGDKCQRDYDCNGDSKCCDNGCQKECVSKDKPGEDKEKLKRLAGKCPKPWKNGRFCDRMGDRCRGNNGCYGNFMCCFNGCQKDCVKPVDLTQCQEEKQNAMDQLAGELPPIGIFVPRCAAKGSYEQVQCSGSTGYCWCVDESGIEINGTTIRGTPDCTASVDLTQCQEEKQNAMVQLAGELPVVGIFVPRCAANGSYEQVQCSGSMGYCWCVDENGIEINGTSMRGTPDCTASGDVAGVGVAGTCPLPTKGKNGICDRMGDKCTIDSTCRGANQKCCFNGCQRQCFEAVPTGPVNLTRCQAEKQNAMDQLSDELPPIGIFVPSCTANGSYEQVQCSASMGYCWCVDENGIEINGTSIRGTPDCTASVSVERDGKCPKPWKASQGFCDFRGDACDEDNQCPFTQKCCSNGCQRDCVYPDGASPCKTSKKAATNTGLGGVFVGQFTPRCRADGFYERVQCHASVGYCWCVDVYGNELPRTRIRGQPNCNNPGDVAGVGVAGTCPLPTKGENGICDRMGDKCTIDSTCRGANRKCCFNGCRRQCLEAVPTKPILTRCQEKLKRAKGPFGLPPPGTFIPSCKADGSFNETQCHDSVGDCWCVHSKTGEEIDSTRISIRDGGQPPICSDAGLTKCQIHYRDSLELPPIGRFQPSCEDGGKYESVQCHGSTGHCWCVDDNGNELSDTRIRGRPDCKPKFDPCAGVRCPYYGRCVASKEGSTSCECSKFCTFEWMPICGSDGKTYGNECEMKVKICSSKQMITVAFRGKCPKADDKACDPRIKCDHPRQLCFMRNSTPVCECPLVKCSGDKKPVCGTDGKTYKNKCLMDVYACKNSLKNKEAYAGECKGVMADPCSISLCSHPQQTCRNINNTAVCECREFTSLELDPRCATDRKTYPNRMSMENAGCKKNMILKVAKNDRCETVEKLGRCPAMWQVSGVCKAGGKTCTDDGSCYGTMKCCYSGCDRECINVADYMSCSENCGQLQTCIGFADGSSRCVCQKGTIMEGNTCKLRSRITTTPPPKLQNPCDISLCSFPRPNCVVVNGTATCECPKYCTRHPRPVCGSDGKTYNNMCMLEVEACKPENTDELTLNHKGRCKIIESVCATTPCSHPRKQCREMFDQHICVCLFMPLCSGAYNPVCGSDGKTYTNGCLLGVVACESSQNIKVVSQGPCPERGAMFDPCTISSSLCNHPQHVCHNSNGTAVCKCREVMTLQHDPKCASDGKTYPNRMSMENAGCKKEMILKVVKNGKCEDEDEAKTGSCPAPWTGLNGNCNRRGNMCEDDIDCSGPAKCCFNGCQKDCVNVADNLKCADDCAPNQQCVALDDGSTQCLCKNDTVMNMDGTCTGAMADPCSISLCSHPQHVCHNINNTAVCKCREVMTLEHDPKCASDGKTYPNLMSMENAGCKKNVVLVVVKDGKCETMVKPGSCPAPWTGLNGNCNRRGSMCEDDIDCSGPAKCCFNGCQKDCINMSDNRNCSEVCASNQQCVAFPGGSMRCLCKKGTVMNMDGTCRVDSTAVVSNPCDISLCDFPTTNCVVVNNTATCECPKICTLEYDLVCGTDKKTYSNMCDLAGAACKLEDKHALKRAHGGPCLVSVVNPCDISLCDFPTTNCVVVNNTATCKCPKICTLKYDPVCGTDKKTYSNMCDLASAACKAEDKHALKRAHDGPCPPVSFNEAANPCDISMCAFPTTHCVVVNNTATCECPKACTADYRPKCGSDGKTYGNMCGLAAAACKPENKGVLRLAHRGECPRKPSCPRTDPKPCPLVQVTGQCVSDANCTNGLMCCHDGCTKVCTRPIPLPIPRPETCATKTCTKPYSVCKDRNGKAECVCRKGCTREYRPVIGSDGNTYSNLCLLRLASCTSGKRITVQNNPGSMPGGNHGGTPGTCPPTDPHPCPPNRRPFGSCRSDSQCPPQSKCCHDGCSRRCIPVIPSLCPKPKARDCLGKHDRKDYCQNASNCPRGQKCCSDGCGKRCGYFGPSPPGSMPGGNHAGAPGANDPPPRVYPPGVSPPGISPPGGGDPPGKPRVVPSG